MDALPVRLRRLLPVLAALLALLAAAGPAAARSGPCRPDDPSGPACTVWTGKVVFVADGDTLDVDVAADGTARPLRVRVTGLQAMEQTVYSRFASRRRGECHALDATRRLEQLIRRSGGRVRLAAQDPAARSGARARRSIAVRRGGRWQDAAAILLGEGRALWLPNHGEWAWNAETGAASERAQRAGLRLFDPESCRPGPGAPDALQVTVNWDADGDDSENANGEWIQVANTSDQDLPLAGWWVRDSALRRFRFPSGAVVPAGQRVRVYVGSGSSRGAAFFWGLSAPAFENADPSHGLGDGGYLFDPDGDLRAWQTYR